MWLYFLCKRAIVKNEGFGCQPYSKKTKEGGGQEEKEGLGAEYLGEMEKSVVIRNEGMH